MADVCWDPELLWSGQRAALEIRSVLKFKAHVPSHYIFAFKISQWVAAAML